MFRLSSPVTLRLGRHETLVFRRGPRARMAVRAGTVHLTRQGDAEDHFLVPGETVDLSGGRWIVVEPAWPDRPVLLSIESFAHGPLHRLLATWLRKAIPASAPALQNGRQVLAANVLGQVGALDVELTVG